MDSRAKWEVTSPGDIEDSDTTRSGYQVDVTAGGGGPTVIGITVTAEDRTTMKYYRVTVTRATVNASTVATLATLTVTPGMSTSEEDADPPDAMKLGEESEYLIDMPYDFVAGDDDVVENTVTIVAAAADGAVVTVKKGNTVIVSATTSYENVAIDEGDNTITVEVLPPSFVTAQKKTYTLTINRARQNASDDARLSSLSLSDGMLMPAFDPADFACPRRRHRRESYWHNSGARTRI